MIYKLLSRLGIEVWKDIPEYEGIYQVSNLGNVKSIKWNKIKYLCSNNKNNFYRAVTLHKNNKAKKHTVAVCVAMAFLSFKPLKQSMVIDHIDNNKHNDYLYNLQVISHRKNLTKDKKPKSGFTGVVKNGKKWKAQIFLNGINKHLGTFENIIEASQAYQQELNKINNE